LERGRGTQLQSGEKDWEIDGATGGGGGSGLLERGVFEARVASIGCHEEDVLSSATAAGWQQ